MNTSSRSVHKETYRGWAIEVIHTTRSDSPLMPSEFTVFIGAELAYDELTSGDQAIKKGRQCVDAWIKAQGE